LVRFLIWSALTQMPGVVVALFVPHTPEYLTLASLLQTALCLGGAGILLCTMQKSNGYSCLHDLVTGTRVIALPEHERAARFPSPSEQAKLATVGDARIGPSRVLGEAGRQGDEYVLRAIDPPLDRPVWLWLRPGDRPAISDARRESHHGTRPRWLAHGEHD